MTSPSALAPSEILNPLVLRRTLLKEKGYRESCRDRELPLPAFSRSRHGIDDLLNDERRVLLRPTKQNAAADCLLGQSKGSWRGERGSPAYWLPFGDVVDGVAGHVNKLLFCPAWPLHLYFAHHCVRSESKMQAHIVRGIVASTCAHFIHLAHRVSNHNHACADCGSVALCTDQPE